MRLITAPYSHQFSISCTVNQVSIKCRVNKIVFLSDAQVSYLSLFGSLLVLHHCFLFMYDMFVFPDWHSR